MRGQPQKEKCIKFVWCLRRIPYLLKSITHTRTHCIFPLIAVHLKWYDSDKICLLTSLVEFFLLCSTFMSHSIEECYRIDTSPHLILILNFFRRWCKEDRSTRSCQSTPPNTDAKYAIRVFYVFYRFYSDANSAASVVVDGERLQYV